MTDYSHVGDQDATATTLTEQYLGILNGYAEEAMGETSTFTSRMLTGSSWTIDAAPAITIDSSNSITIDQGLSGSMPEAPSDYPTAPNSPNMSDYSFSSSPSYVLPTAPTLTDIVVPDFIEGTINPISSTLPTITFDVPAVPQIQSGGEVAHDSLMQATKAKLESNILNGGTMLNADVEDDIWNRDLERNEQALQDAIDKLTGQWAKLGFSAPDGLLSGSIIAINKEYTNKRLDRSREIAIKQAELEQVGMFKSLELATGLEQIIMTANSDYARRILESSKATADVAIEIYKQRVVQYNAMLEAYKADVMAYKTQIEAEMVRAEAFKARISGLQVIAQVDESRVKVYASHIDAIGKLVDIYKTEIQAVGLMYEAEKTKIERFKSQVEAYIAQVESVTKKYSAEIEGFKAYVQAYVASTDSQTKILDINVRAQIASVEATIKEWEIKEKLEHDNNALRIEAAKAQAQVSSNIAAGAMSGINVAASTQYQSALNESHNYSY